MKYLIQLVLAVSLIHTTFGNISEEPVSMMKTKVIIRELNERKLSDLKDAPVGEVDSARMIIYLIHQLSSASDDHVTVHWSLSKNGWSPPKSKWKIKDHKNLTLRAMLRQIIDSERWGFKITDGVLLVRQYIE